jgi:D-alanyl-D-alanine dipeptidase
VENVSNPEYVADPAKGSIHNRGGADITLVDKNGKELDMGTQFDFFESKLATPTRNYLKISSPIGSY